MKLDIDKIKAQADMSEEAFAQEMNISVDELHQYCEGTMPLPQELLNNMCQFTGLQPGPGGIFMGASSASFAARPIKPDYTFSPAQQTKSNLVEYIKQGIQEFQEDSVKSEIERIQSYVSFLKKPRISFAGQSDTGKSSLINTLLGAEKMPAKWTPTTSIAVHIKHIDDRPAFMNEDVWIFGKKNTEQNEQWDDRRLNDEDYCKEFCIEKGGFELLSEFGTHQGEQENQKLASSAVAFIDAPLLKNCDILDLPGFAATAEDDALHRFNTQENVTDILLYLSRANGFLQDRDLDYLHECLKSLSPIEQNGKNNLSKLGNLFVIASQAGAVDNGNSTELKEIMRRRCKALCESYALAADESNSVTLLPFRTKKTGYDYKEEDFLARFFTYEKNMSRLCQNFNSVFTALSEDLPKSFYQEFNIGLKEIVSECSYRVQQRVDEWNDMLCSKEKYAALYREIEQKEPARKVEQKALHKKMAKRISTFATETKQDIQSKYDKIMNTAYIVDLIDERKVKNKKGDKEDFTTTINELLSNQVQTILANKTEEYNAELDNYLKEYAQSFNQYSANKDVDVKFDSTNSFALGLTGLGALGASATWLATSFTAWSVAAFGTLAGWGPIMAVGGVVGIAIGAVIASVVALVKAFSWKKDFAQSIIDAYRKKEYLEAIFTDVEQYWRDTKDSFAAGCEQVEKDWQEKSAFYKSLADESSIPILESKIAEGKKSLDFFTKIPLPEIG